MEGEMMEWIKLVDRKPPKYCNVLVTDLDRCWVAQISENSDFFMACNPDYKREPEIENCEPYLTQYQPIYWMPLPYPPNTNKQKVT